MTGIDHFTMVILTKNYFQDVSFKRINNLVLKFFPSLVIAVSLLEGLNRGRCLVTQNLPRLKGESNFRGAERIVNLKDVVRHCPANNFLNPAPCPGSLGGE